MKKELKKIALIALSAYLLISLVFSFVYFNFIFGRNTNESPYSYSDYSDRYPRTEVQFYSGKNRLTGYFYNNENAKGIVIVTHGMNSDSDSHLPETAYFVDNGWSVFSFDGTGSGKSEGRSVVGFPQMRIDLGNAIDYISSTYPDSRIVLYGHSSGGYAVCTVNHEHISSVVSIGGFNSPTETMMFYGKEEIGYLAYLEYPFICLGNLIKFKSNVSAVDSLNRTQIPVLVIQGSDDRVVYEKISIYGHRSEIVNEKVSYMHVLEDENNDHNDTWLDGDRIDVSFMNQINAFFSDSLKQKDSFES